MWPVLFLTFAVGVTVATNSSQQTCSPSDHPVQCDDRATWDNFMLKAFAATDKLDQFIKPRLKSALVNSNVSEPCFDSMVRYLEGVKKWEPWAIRMADANGRLPSGFLTGSKMSFGAFDQCLEVRASVDEAGSFKGQYCMVGFRSPLLTPIKSTTSDGKSYTEAYGYPPNWILDVFETQQNIMKTAGFWIGHCIPSTCTEQDIKNFYGFVMKPWTSSITVTDCQTDDPREWTSYEKSAACILLTLAAICILGTCLDSEQSDASTDCSFVRRVFLCFSVKTNAKKLFEIREKDRTPLNALNGIRFCLSLYVVGQHVLAIMDHYKEMRYSDIYRVAGKYFSVPYLAHFENGLLLVENFYTISGLVLGIVFAKQMVLYNGKFDFKDFFLQRYFRIIPMFLFTLTLLYFLPTMSSGPIWNSTWGKETATCQNSWWRNLLFIQNFWHLNEICLVQTWFMGCFLQTQIVGLLVLIILYRNPKVGGIVAAVLTAVSIYIDYSTAYFYKYPMLAQKNFMDIRMVEDYLSHIYVRPFNHIPSTFVGMALAAVLFFFRNKEFSKTFYVVGWITAIIVSQVLTYAIYIPDLDVSTVALYIATRNIFWSISFSWTIFACFKGYGGLLNYIFSLDAFIPLSRISFCIYLLHPLVIFYRAGLSRSTQDIEMFALIFEMAGVSIFTLVLSTVVYICVELPFTHLYYTVFKSRRVPQISSDHQGGDEKMKFS